MSALLYPVISSVMVWLVLCLGGLEKEQKFWSTSTYIITAIIIPWALYDMLDGSTVTGDFTIRDVVVLVLGLTAGLVYCDIAGQKIQESKKHPLAARISSLLIAYGLVAVFVGLMRWLRNL